MLSKDGFQQGQLANTPSNMIQKQISINTDNLLSSHYAKFSEIEQSHGDSLYHTVIDTKDGSASVVVIDEKDDEKDGKMSVVGFNIFSNTASGIIDDLKMCLHCDFEKVKLTKQEIQFNENRIRLTLDEANEDSYTFDVKGNFHRIISYPGEVLSSMKIFTSLQH